MIEKLVADIGSEDRDTKRRGLEQLGDYLEYGDWEPSVVALFLNRLVAMLREASDEEFKELILNDLLIAFTRGTPQGVSLQPLAELTSSLSSPLLIYCLYILGLSHEQEFRPIIERFRQHPDKQVRETVEEALIEIGGRPRQ